MLNYPLIAKTIKTIDQFRYNMYNDISINMLKYNNDSSSILRILSSLIDTSCDILADLSYKPRFDMSAIDFITIDRFNGFNLKYIPEAVVIDEATITCEELVGYSRYTDKNYKLEYIKDDKDFTRHSLPCDCIIGEQVFSDGYEVVDLPPNVKVSLDMKIKNSSITIAPQYGFNSVNMEDKKTATIRIYGVSITGKEAHEDIVISSTMDHTSSNEYSFLTGAMAMGVSAQLNIVIYPYLNGEYASWEDITDRDTHETYKSIVTLDVDNKTLEFNSIRENIVFPNYIDQHRLVELDMPQIDDIWAHYIDKNNKLVYVISSSDDLYCFPLIIPTKYSSQLDDLKTTYQSMKIAYSNDTINKMYTFYVFPSMRTNDIEAMSIFINGDEYLGENGKYSNMILDLFRSNIETNRIEIPYTDIFVNSREALVEIRTYGTEESNFPMYLTDLKLEPLYIKKLDRLLSFTSGDKERYTQAAMTSNNIGYVEYVTPSMNINNQCTLIKLSSISNILINGHRIENVFNTFTYSETDSVIITSDTITHVTGAKDVI